MDGILKAGQVGEQRVVANRQNRMKIQKKNMRSKSMSNPCDKNYAGGVMNPPCYDPFVSSSSFYYHQQNQLPPLLPLPTVSSSPSAKSRKSRSIDMSNNNKTKQNMGGMFHTPVVCTSSFRSTAMAGNGFGSEMMDSGSWVFNLSPPPSSLPVPKFCVRRSKLNCNAETN